jgi:hypothetical protein
LKLAISIPPILLVIVLAPLATFVKGTNEVSYLSGFWSGSGSGPQNNSTLNNYPIFDNNTCSITHSSTLQRQLTNGIVMPAITNTTSCLDGYFLGYKTWCIHHAIDCVENITMGVFPDMILKTHQEYLKGANAANDTGASMCPIGENAVFCSGWDSNNDDYGDQDCADTPLANITTSLMRCIGDTLTENQIGGLPALVGKWNFVNQSSTGANDISGTILFNNNGYSKMIVPSKTGFGDYSLESSWGVVPHHILTICYAGGCENGTLTRVTQNYVDFTDNNNDTIHLMRFHPSSSTTIVPTTAQQQPQSQQRNATLLYQEGQTQVDLQNYTGAQSLYQKALAIDPHDESLD